tara:strand:- start:152 stop:301 length:150 start_codon:yes stop_codon:yes gene_type:complete
MNGPKSILVIKPDAFGDFIHVFGPIAAFLDHHRDAHIKSITTEGFKYFT